MTTVADAVATAIAGHAADRVFAYPGGGSNLELIEALGRQGVEIVLTRSEGGAALMASAYADLVGRPAVVLVGLGPGVANVVNGVAHAHLDQSALLVISDRFAEDELGTSGHQVLDHDALLAPVVKWTATLAAEGAETCTVEALAVAGRAPRGPVHLALARDVARAPARAARGSAAPAAASRTVPAPAAGALDDAARLVSAAQRPVLLVGDEALDARLEDLVALAERLGAPVLTSYKGKGAFPERHPLWCGLVTNAAIEAAVLDEADVLLAVGLDPVELLPRPWTAPGKVVALREHHEVAPGLRALVTVQGALGPLVRSLAGRLRSGSPSWRPEEVTARRDAMFDALRVEPADGPAALEVVEAVREAAPRDATATVDAGAHMFAATWGWRAEQPRSFLISNGLATMGFAVPAAIAAALARPGAPVVAFTGDGGFVMHAAEIETAVRVGARLVVVVFNDSSLSLIRIKQHGRGQPRAAVDFGTVDAAALAVALGARGATASSARTAADAVAAALERPGPTVVEVSISGEEYGELERVIRTTGPHREPAWAD